jgi:hypothetical protein
MRLDNLKWEDRENLALTTIDNSILEILSKDNHYKVRWAVAKNQNVDKNILSLLSQDKYEWIRESVLFNKNVSHEIIMRLCFDSDEDIRKIAQEKQSVICRNCNNANNTYYRNIVTREQL